jgi:hypothetical protein
LGPSTDRGRLDQAPGSGLVAGEAGGTRWGGFKKQGVYWIDYYVSGHRKREGIGPDKRLAVMVLRKRTVEIAEGELDRNRIKAC